jgi:hypothetical protein
MSMIAMGGCAREETLSSASNVNKGFDPSAKFLAGCQAVSGKPIAEIANEIGMSRTYVYQQKAKVLQYAEGLDTDEPKVPVLVLDRKTIDRMILSLALDCQSPISGIVRFFETAIGKTTVSAGYISGLIAKASQQARIFDDQIDLSGICQGANDEIFQCGIPVLTGIDPESTFTYLLEEASDRTAETWALYLDDRKGHGLNLKTSINDGGAGLMAGIPQTFPDVEIQADTFHATYTMGKELSKLERRAYKLMKGEHAIEENLASKKPRAKNKEALNEIRPKVADAIRIYDLLSILFAWIKEMLGFSGYSTTEALDLITWVLQEMDILAGEYPGLRTEIAKMRKMLPSLLSFIGRLDRAMEESSNKTGLPVEGFRLMYQQLSCGSECPESNEMLYNQVLMLGERYMEARGEFESLLNGTKKASSLVENLNGRIRVYIEVKRIIPPDFFILLKVYFNTRRYKRSRCKERIGKSPLELLTGTPQPQFLEAIGY